MSVRFLSYSHELESDVAEQQVWDAVNMIQADPNNVIDYFIEDALE